MDWLTRLGNGCLMAGVALIASVTLLAGDKMTMATTPRSTCSACLDACNTIPSNA